MTSKLAINTTIMMNNSSNKRRRRLWEPHIAFCITSVMLKIFFPSFLQWLANDTITTLLVGVWYPLTCTMLWIHRERHEQQQQQQGHQAETTDGQQEQQRQRQFWIDYWSLSFSIIQFLQHGWMMIVLPMFQHHHQQQFQFQQQKLSPSPTLYYFSPTTLLSEIKFLFFVWIFTMRPVLIWYQRFLSLDKDKEDWMDYEPLALIKHFVRPKLLDLYMTISEPVSKDTWQRYIHSNVRRLLELAVVFQFLTDDGRDYVLTLLDEGRSLLLLSVFLVVPSSVTNVGIVYVKTLLPAARSSLAMGRHEQVLYLQYWVLNNLLSVAISMGSWFWWWIPFSTQITFGIWCYLTFPRTITEYYTVVEMELVTFGLLSGESQLAVEETKTVQALRALVRRIPSANDASGFQWLEQVGPNNNNDDDDDDDVDDDDWCSSDDSESDGVSRRRRHRKKKQQQQKRRSNKKTLVPRSKSSPATILLDKVTVGALHDIIGETAEEENAFVNPTHYDDDPKHQQYLPRSSSLDDEHHRHGAVFDLPLASISNMVRDEGPINFGTSSSLPSTKSHDDDNDDVIMTPKQLGCAPSTSMDVTDFGDDVPLHNNSLAEKENSERTLPPSMSLIEESDDSSVFSSQAVCNVEITSSVSAEEYEESLFFKQRQQQHDEEHQEEHATTKDTRASQKQRQQQRVETRKVPPAPEGYRIPLPMRYNRSNSSLLLPLSGSEEKVHCLSPLSRLTVTTMASSSLQTTAPGERNSWDNGVYLSEVDTMASSMIEGDGSFESSFVPYYEEQAARDMRRNHVASTKYAAAAAAAATSRLSRGQQDNQSTVRRSARLKTRIPQSQYSKSSLGAQQQSSFDSGPFDGGVLSSSNGYKTGGGNDISPSNSIGSYGNGGNRIRRREMMVGSTTTRDNYLDNERRHTASLPRYVRIDASDHCSESSPQRRSRRQRR